MRIVFIAAIIIFQFLSAIVKHSLEIFYDIHKNGVWEIYGMSYSLDIEHKNGYLHVVVRGENSLTNVLAYFEEVYGACLLYHCSNVLIEEHLLGPCLDTFDIFVVITKNYVRAKTIGLRLAFIDVSADRDIQGLKFGENLAHIRGVNVKLFHHYNIEEMVSWLLIKDTKAP